MNPRSLFAASLATVALAVAAPGARADYSLVTGNGGTFTFGTPPKSTAFLGGTYSTPQVGVSTIDIQNVQDFSSASPAAPDTGTIHFTFNLKIIQQIGGGDTFSGAANENVTGSITFTSSSTGGETSYLSAFQIAPLVIGTTTYNFSDVLYVPPAVNGGKGKITLEVTPSTAAVSEPASLAMMGIGLGGLGLVRRLRRRTA